MKTYSTIIIILGVLLAMANFGPKGPVYPTQIAFVGFIVALLIVVRTSKFE